MASIRKNPQSGTNNWFAAFRGADGRRKCKSTGTTDRQLALRMAVEWERLAKMGRAGALNETQLRKVLSEISEEARGIPLHFASASEYLNAWLKKMDGAVELASFRKYSQAIKEFILSLGDRSRLPLTSLTSADVTTFRDRSTALGRAPGTIKGLIKPIRAALQDACNQGAITHNPCDAVPNLKDKEKKPKQCFSREQIKTLLDAADDEWRGLILFGYFTGMRLQDIVHLTWENIDLPAGGVWCIERKKKKYHSWELHPQLLEWLKQKGAGRSTDCLFPELHSLSEGHLSRSFTRFMARVGVVGTLIRCKRGVAGRNLNGLTFHSLRHTFISHLDAQGVPEDLRVKVIGHASVDVHRGYVHHADDRTRGIISAIPGIL